MRTISRISRSMGISRWVSRKQQCCAGELVHRSAATRRSAALSEARSDASLPCNCGSNGCELGKSRGDESDKRIRYRMVDDRYRAGAADDLAGTGPVLWRLGPG